MGKEMATAKTKSVEKEMAVEPAKAEKATQKSETKAAPAESVAAGESGNSGASKKKTSVAGLWPFPTGARP